MALVASSIPATGPISTISPLLDLPTELLNKVMKILFAGITLRFVGDWDTGAPNDPEQGELSESGNILPGDMYYRPDHGHPLAMLRVCKQIRDEAYLLAANCPIYVEVRGDLAVPCRWDNACLSELPDSICSRIVAINTYEPFPDLRSVISGTLGCCLDAETFVGLKFVGLICAAREIPAPADDDVFRALVDQASRTYTFAPRDAQYVQVLRSLPGWIFIRGPVMQGRVSLAFRCKMRGTLLLNSEPGGELFETGGDLFDIRVRAVRILSIRYHYSVAGANNTG